MEKLKSHQTFGGETAFWLHESHETGTAMKFATFIPSVKRKGCLIWLSGLTCTEENFITKASAQRYLQEHGLMVIAPDTSPRGTHLPAEHDSYDFGSGAGFYVDATVPGYDQHYRMESYVVKELVDIIRSQFQETRLGIFGHSMGGHGALTLALRHPEIFRSVSAFAPIVNPTLAPWGRKAFAGYLGPDEELWREHDACELLKAGKKYPGRILIHQGSKDDNLEKQLLTHKFAEAALAAGQDHEIKLCEGYDHSYYFISSFIEKHIQHHVQQLGLL